MSQIVEYNKDNAKDYEWFDGFAVIRFYADWCAPCVQNFPVFEQCASQMSSQHARLKFGKVNVDSSPILTLRYKVYGLPSTLVFYRGQVIQRIAGDESLSELTAIILSAMQSHSDND